MAKNTITVLLFLLPFLALPLISTPAAAIGGKVGGRRDVKNVESNKEVQDLGRYCVQEYNRQQKMNGSASAAKKLLVFSEVVKAETQVVSGINYYLKISAAARGGGGAEIFDAVVVVKPWVHSKELLAFAPSPSRKNTK